MKIVVELDENKIIDVTIEQYIDYGIEIDVDEVLGKEDAREFKLSMYSTLKNSKKFKDHVQWLCNGDSHLEDMMYEKIYEEVDVSGVVETLVKHLPMVKKAKAAYKKLEQKESQKYKNQQLERLHKEAKNAGFKLVKL